MKDCAPKGALPLSRGAVVLSTYCDGKTLADLPITGAARLKHEILQAEDSMFESAMKKTLALDIASLGS
jgi:hypothetical protein